MTPERRIHRTLEWDYNLGGYYYQVFPDSPLRGPFLNRESGYGDMEFRNTLQRVYEGHEHEFLSQCCGAKWLDEGHSFCAACREHTGFDCECGKEYA